jgi:hypothetical protein
MSRTYRKNDSNNWRHAEAEYTVCLACNTQLDTSDWWYRSSCCGTYSTFTKWKQLKTFRDGKGSNEYTSVIKEFCRSRRRSQEKIDIYNCVMYNDLNYLDTESKCKGARWIFD